ncbi:ribonuclease H1 [Echria macrotheca]|uniref:ribonuclease H n=1 Tax=Echria macrotheca TaxID=438768 RepID=A0AAJ0F2C2_9PEZI|nr:ribonuclease H1 [Echria macrotheca]
MSFVPGLTAGQPSGTATTDPIVRWVHEFIPLLSALPRDDSLRGNKLRRGVGLVFPTKFALANTSISPSRLFSGRWVPCTNVVRYTLPTDTTTVLIHTDGACLGNGQANPRAGWAFWHASSSTGDPLTADGRLERKGPFGDDSLQTNNRAELRAVIAALRYRNWPGEGIRTLVIATDSAYVVEGATTWARGWIQNGWMTQAGPVLNRDLWETLLGEVERFFVRGMTIKFWRIPRAWNAVADAAAKAAAQRDDDALEEWADKFGFM